MNSAAWQEKRREWYHRWVDANGSSPGCLVCGQQWSLRTGHLHHVTYMRLGYEDLEDLIPLCAAHHARLHEVFDHSTQWRREGRAAASRRQTRRPGSCRGHPSTRNEPSAVDEHAWDLTVASPSADSALSRPQQDRDLRGRQIFVGLNRSH